MLKQLMALGSMEVAHSAAYCPLYHSIARCPGASSVLIAKLLPHLRDPLLGIALWHVVSCSLVGLTELCWKDQPIHGPQIQQQLDVLVCLRQRFLT